MEDQQAKRIAELNDIFRLTFFTPSPGPRPVPGRMVCTSGIAALPLQTQIAVWLEVSRFSDFEEGDDPYGEHDFGAFDMDGVPENIIWKIDYYADETCETGAEVPSDPQASYRLLTIMLASEY